MLVERVEHKMQLFMLPGMDLQLINHVQKNIMVHLGQQVVLQFDLDMELVEQVFKMRD